MPGLNDSSIGDDLVVALPPEILAMMAAFEAAPEADEAASAPQDAAIAEPPVPGPDASADLPPEILAAFAAARADEGGENGEDGDAEPLVLDPVLDITAAAGLHAQLLERRGAPLTIEAGEVRRLGGQCLQLLVSARKTWAADGRALRLGAISPAFERDLALLGCRPSDLISCEAA